MTPNPYNPRLHARAEKAIAKGKSPAVAARLRVLADSITPGSRDPRNEMARVEFRELEKGAAK